MGNDKKCVLFVDGENFLFRVSEILKDEKKIKHKSDITHFDLVQLCANALSDFVIAEKRFYAARLHVYKDHPGLIKKSQAIVESQRRLKRNLSNQGVDFIISGHVRLQEVLKTNGKSQAVFKEKGTDVQIAVDMVAGACDGALETALLLSSDSDMQPAVSELKKRGVKIVYIGFEQQPNAGLSAKCDRTILLRKKEIIEAWEGKQKLLI